MNSQLTTSNEANINYKSAIDLFNFLLEMQIYSSYIEAIPLLKSSADASSCRSFHCDKSYWEEGNEYERRTLLYLKCLNNVNDACIMVCNAYNAYVNGGFYESRLSMLMKRADDFM